MIISIELPPLLSKIVLAVIFPLLLLINAGGVCAQPLDDIVERTLVRDKAVLTYAPLREHDIFWEKRIWRLLDVREKINLPLVYPQAPFFDLLKNAALSGELTVYSTDDFTTPLSVNDLNDMLFKTDTVEIWSEYESTWQVIREEIFYEDVKRFRLQEVWYFDSQRATLRARILGIAPLKETLNPDGSFRYEKPLFWVHYPSAREFLARQLVFVEGNASARLTWDDCFEMRLFSSYIVKEANVQDKRLADLYSGVDLLLAADKIKQEIFHFEMDLWEY